MLLTATCGSTAPGILAMFTRRAAALTPVSVITGWRPSGVSLIPAVTTVPSEASTTPETSCAAAVPNGRAWCQAWPSAEANAVRFRTAAGHQGGEPGRRSEGRAERPGQAVRRGKDVDRRLPGYGGRPEQDEPVAGRRHAGDLRLRAVAARRAGSASSP